MAPMDGGQEATEVVIMFDSAVSAAERRNLVDALTQRGVPARRGLDTGFRSTSPDQVAVVTIAVLTMLSTGFVKRLGERTADGVLHVFTTARDWLRRQPTSATPAQVEIVDHETGLEFRVSAGDPDAAGQLLAEALRTVSDVQQTRPLRWSNDQWKPDGGQPIQTQHRQSPPTE